jgi:succinoglycan biosynthesis transport protein ExoP
MNKQRSPYKSKTFNDPSDSGDASERQFNLRELWMPIVSWRRLVLAIFVLGILAGCYMASKPRRYLANGSMRIQPGAASAYQISPSEALSGGSAADTKINTEISIMQSRTIVVKVATDLNLANEPAFWGVKKLKQARSINDPDTREAVIERMRGILLVAHEPKNEIVDISCTTTSPALSAKIVNSIINEYIAHIFQVRYGSTERVSKWLVSQLDDLKKQVEQDQEQLVSLQDRLGILGLDQKSSDYLVADALQGITRASGEATITRIIAEAKLRFLQDSDPNLIESEQPMLQNGVSTQGGLLQSLRNSQAEAKAAYADLTAKFGPTYPDVKQAKARLDTLNQEVAMEQARILNQAKVSYSAAKANEEMTERTLADHKEEAFRSHDNMVRYVVLQREYESNRVLYEGLMQRLRVAGINAGLESAQVDVVDIADVPTRSRFPSPLAWLVLCAVVSVLLGAFLAILADVLDTRLDSAEDAEKQLGLPLLAMLPLIEPPPFGNPFPILTAPQSGYSEGVQLLRSSILLARAEGPPRSLLITSSFPGEGKSTVARNLAAMFATHGARVLLIDADLHKPSQTAELKLRSKLGLSELLSSDARLKDVVLPVPAVPGLSILPTGPLPPNPATLLSSNRMKLILEEALAAFDFVVIDSSPVLSVSDPVLCASFVDMVLFVVRDRITHAKPARQAISLLARGNGDIGGFVMNGVDNRLNPYRKYYNYGNYGTTDGAKEKK